MKSQHDDERFAARLREWAGDYQAPPETPREVMWQAIARERAERRQASRRPPWSVWAVPAAIAATLVLGIALGRMTANQTPTVPVGPAVAAGLDVPVGNVAFELATRDHVRRVETFLSVFQSEARAGRLDASFGPAARTLAVQNRMLLRSPAVDDPAVRQLLDDVEVVLMQIQQYDVTGKHEDLEFIDDGIAQRGVLLKLRALATQGAS